MVIRRAVLDLQGRRTVYDTKTHALRWIRIDAETARMLRAQRDNAKELAEAAGVEFSTDDFVFPRAPGSSEPLPPNRIGQAWRRLCREVGVGPVAPSNLKLGEKTEDLLLAVEAPAVHVIDTSSAVGEGARRTASVRCSNVRSGAASSTASRYQLSGCPM